MRLGLLVRLQIVAASLLTSPLATPYGILGRTLSAVTRAGAVPCAQGPRRLMPPVRTLTPARATADKNARRFMMAIRFPSLSRGANSVAATAWNGAYTCTMDSTSECACAMLARCEHAMKFLGSYPYR